MARCPAMLKMLTGCKVRLRELTHADLPTRARWTADTELAILMGVSVPDEPFVSEQDELRRNRDWLDQRHRAGATIYAIEAAGRYIGDIDITIVPEERQAELTLFIGEGCEWGQGCGTETVELVLDQLFGSEPVDTVEVDVAPANDTACGSGRSWASGSAPPTRPAGGTCG